MRARSPLLIGSLALACTATASGPALWDEACEVSLRLVGDSDPEHLRECKTDMSTRPIAVSDDMARCVLAGSELGTAASRQSAFDSCINSNTQDYLAKVGAAYEVLDAVAACISASEAEQGKLPARLPDRAGCPTKGPWGGALRYAPGSDGNYELCVIGPDATPDTPDDLCRAPNFIYFQF